MSPQNHSGEISLYQTPPYVTHLQTVWRLYGDGMETHRFSVPAGGDQDDLITLEGWTPKHGSLTLNPATGLVQRWALNLHVRVLSPLGLSREEPRFPQVKPSV